MLFTEKAGNRQIGVNINIADLIVIIALDPALWGNFPSREKSSAFGTNCSITMTNCAEKTEK